MNAKQLDTWQQLVQQCKTQCERQPYSSINVASRVRSDAILAADALVELVTPELAALLEQMALLLYTSGWQGYAKGEIKTAGHLAARVREALALEASDEAR